jgi:hypothetical protein
MNTHRDVKADAAFAQAMCRPFVYCRLGESHAEALARALKGRALPPDADVLVCFELNSEELA